MGAHVARNSDKWAQRPYLSDSADPHHFIRSTMRRRIGMSVPLILALAPPAMAQSAMPAGPTTPPPIIQRYREMVKVGRGDAHEANEKGWSAAYAKAKIPYFSVAMTAMTGPNDAWFMSGWPSFKALDDANTAVAKDKELTAAISGFAIKDAEDVSDAVASIWALRPDLSYRDTVAWSEMHAYEMITVRARPGHNDDIKKIAEKIRATHVAAHTSARWAMYQGVMGVPDGTFLVMIPHKTVADLDIGMKEDAQFGKALGDVGAKELDKLSNDGVISVQTDLFAVSAKMSYVSEDWRASDADFWKGAAVMQAGAPAAAAKKESKKP
jgi:hypothetical protein